MIDLKLINKILFGYKPLTPSLALGSADDLFDQGLTMGTLFIGRQGTGKTTSLARHLVEYFKKYPDRAIFVLDWSGSISDTILNLILQEERGVRDQLLKRVVYDELGNPDWVIPMPEFSSLYGLSYDKQVQRVVENLEKLSPYLIQNAPILGGVVISEIAPHFFRLLTAITNDAVDASETWQITETKRLMLDRTLLKSALSRYGDRVPETKSFLLNEFLNQDTKSSERELRTYSLRGILNMLDSREIKARLGYYRPGWTAKEAITNGKMVLVDGARLINQTHVQHYLFTQVYSLIMAEIKKRRPADPNDKPVSIVLDEVYSLLAIPGMAPELSQLSPQYRSRKMQLYVVLQELAQMSKELRPHIWSLGNVVSFAISNFDEAYEIAQQLFRYEPSIQKLPPIDNKHQPILENDRGQYLEIANWIQRLPHRACIMRRFTSEKQAEKVVRHIPQTKTNAVVNITNADLLNQVKAELMQIRGVRVRDALEIINLRSLQAPAPASPPVI